MSGSGFDLIETRQESRYSSKSDLVNLSWTPTRRCGTSPRATSRRIVVGLIPSDAAADLMSKRAITSGFSRSFG
jgi:hypothetical protein